MPPIRSLPSLSMCLPSWLAVLTAVTLVGCAQLPGKTPPAASPRPCHCKEEETKPALPLAPPLEPAVYGDLPGWQDDDLQEVFSAFVAQCSSLQKQVLWRAVCASAKAVEPGSDVRAWFEANLRPWQLQNPDASKNGLITGYYEPLLRGSRQEKGVYVTPVFAAPADLITVDLSELYPELKNLRLRGRIEGKKLVPYYSRADWANQAGQRKPLLWVDDELDFFFMQVQGSGQVEMDDGSRIRLGYADQNGHPYHSIGRWLIDKGELKLEQASMQGIKAWAQANPKRVRELLNANPSMVFFRELKAEGSGPPGAMGVPLTPERSVAIDPRYTQLGSPVWLATTYPNSERPLNRLMLAQDTGGAIRGAVRADFYWGSGAAAGQQAGKMKQSGQMWVLLPRSYTPPAPK